MPQNIQSKGLSKFQSPVWSSFACLKHTCPSVWKRPESVPCGFLFHRREGEKNHQHMDGLDPDLGKVFLCGKTYDWRLSDYGPEGNRELEQRALHPSNSHGTLLLGRDGNNAENNRPEFSSSFWAGTQWWEIKPHTSDTIVQLLLEISDFSFNEHLPWKRKYKWIKPI